MTYDKKWTTRFVQASFFLIVFAISFFVPESAHAFQVSPTRQTIVVDPGASQIIPVTVINDSNARQMFTPELSAFTIDSKTGSPIFDQEDEVSGWFRVLPERLLLQPGQSGTFSFTVSVPGSAEPKSHYLGLFAKSEPSAGQIGVSTRLGSLLFLHISGEVRESLVRERFTVDPFITRGGDATIRLVLENAGTIHVVPDGIVTVKDRSGAEISTFPLNPDGRKILPGGLFEAEYPVSGLSADHIGPLRASVNMRYGATQKELHDGATFWYIPGPIFFSGIAAILFLLLFFFLKNKSRKKKSVTSAKR